MYFDKNEQSGSPHVVGTDLIPLLGRSAGGSGRGTIRPACRHRTKVTLKKGTNQVKRPEDLPFC